MRPALFAAASGGGETRVAVAVEYTDSYQDVTVPAGTTYVSLFMVMGGYSGDGGSISPRGGSGGDGGRMRYRVNLPVAGHTKLSVFAPGSDGMEGAVCWDASQGTIILDNSTVGTTGGIGGRGALGNSSPSPYYGGGGGGPGGLLSNGGVGEPASGGVGGTPGDTSPVPELAAHMGQGGGNGTGTNGLAWGGAGGGGRGGLSGQITEGGNGADGGVLLLFHNTVISTAGWISGAVG